MGVGTSLRPPLSGAASGSLGAGGGGGGQASPQLAQASLPPGLVVVERSALEEVARAAAEQAAQIAVQRVLAAMQQPQQALPQ
eukprot:XP_001689576.1 predicted protein [Chlamydomonas reinhardtii]